MDPLLRFDNGHGSVTLRSSRPIRANRQQSIRCQRSGRHGTLIVNGEDIVTAMAPGTHQSLNVEPVLYVGHVSVLQSAIPKR